MRTVRFGIFAILILFTGLSIAANPGGGQGNGPPNFLEELQRERIPVSIFLVNGIKLQGQIEDFDSSVILLKNSVSQLVYKHAISTVVPSRNP